MTSEEINRTIEFIIQQSAQFSIGMQDLKQRNEEFFLELKELKEQTARFETWAAEVVAIHSRRLDQNDKWINEMKAQHQTGLEELRHSRNEILRRIDFLIDRLFPPQN
jgi:hypothetical protein